MVENLVATKDCMTPTHLISVNDYSVKKSDSWGILKLLKSFFQNQFEKILRKIIEKNDKKWFLF